MAQFVSNLEKIGLMAFEFECVTVKTHLKCAVYCPLGVFSQLPLRPPFQETTSHDSAHE